MSAATPTTGPTPRIVSADITSNGLIVEFEGGVLAVFSHQALFAMVADGQLLNDQGDPAQQGEDGV